MRVHLAEYVKGNRFNRSKQQEYLNMATGSAGGRCSLFCNTHKKFVNFLLFLIQAWAVPDSSWGNDSDALFELPDNGETQSEGMSPVGVPEQDEREEEEYKNDEEQVWSEEEDRDDNEVRCNFRP